ncbi:PREDICTED: uncharacterized protein LOC109178466 [Ipomoea nil]|uniref:uncharacterized protein LOC109178466 n=1 Tax=Ipomoea nil TaxID=35883 RepID=UPI000901A541|nr:PREDICTED: uncharacterized protein LOC109178466 [Ipomoea nil]
METKVPRIHAERIRVTLGYEGLFYVDNDGLSGGMALLWKKNNTVRLLTYSQSHIDVEVSLFNKLWRMTCIYGIPERGRREETWDLLGTLKTRSLLPWVVIGDFNNLLYQHEKKGGNPYPNSLLRGFGDAVDDCGLMQMPMRGHQFTWQKGKGTPNWIEKRLDKALITNDWGLLNENAWLENIRTRASDHSILFLSINAICMSRGRGPRGFRFEMAWLLDEGCKEVVETAWQEGKTEGLLHCQQLCGEKLMRGLSCDDPLFGVLAPRVTLEQNVMLDRPFENNEVKEALFAMYPDKAPGPDGLNPGFYQQFWEIVGGDVSGFITNALNSCVFPEGLNDTNIVLIPKKEMPETVADLRSIALSNVIYRVMAKMIANRMKTLMGGLISESQSAFIPGRLITDNILVAAEVGHYLKRKQCGRVGWSALKLDMSKAYDRMEWNFLEKMLTVMGFSEKWIKLIMLCVTTVNYTVMVNGIAGGHVKPTRGLRQGDPLSPYLFIICAEALWMILQYEQLAGSIHGCRVARGAPPVSHLFFADDSLLFFKANIQETGVIRQCLERYEKLSGQVVNYNKSNICFSRNTQEADWMQIADCLGVVQAPNFGKYLGLPSFVGRNNRAVFSYVEEKIRQRIGSWSKKLLSQAGSLVAKVYKARYYPTTSFTDATIGNCPSYCWRSIMAAHAMVVSGVRRRIGNGQTTLIWGHPWLRDNPSPLIQTEMPQQLREARVAGLIDLQTHTWDPHILSDLFIPEDVERINMIPVSPEYEDSWYWMSDPKGIYTVKNAYRHIVGDYENNPADFDKWVAMWKIKVPPNSFTTWLKGAMAVLTEEQTRLMVAILYYIWRTRNSAVWKGSMMRPAQLARAATVALQAYGAAHVRRTEPAAASEHLNGSGEGSLRCYVDAGFRHDTGEATYDMIIIAPDGSFVAARNGKLPVCFSPLMAKAQAYKEALSWLLERSNTSIDHKSSYCKSPKKKNKSSLTNMRKSNNKEDKIILFFHGD